MIDLITKIVQQAIQKPTQTINKIADVKKAMYDQNTHNWQPLKPSTVARKSRMKDLYRQADSVNIREGDIYRSQTKSDFYGVKKNSNGADIDIRYKPSKVPAEKKIATMAHWKRDVTVLTSSDMEQITDALTQDIINELKKYER